ncbi:type II toxin-antitoxin system RelE/ParE family toxin [Pseudomonas amygdali pv. morsprunorum]|uniref:Type II toxin-antitoxin system RelE/ParE family toxin n=1 Tax=Pseudomonas amygdali pv. morsprunorum TaxID=129138 RepID=A0AB35QVA9_PSEA0|nr:type II toxin-antitoxin system RelE/ParE family toxin [Pseudomonas amygdali]MDT3239625.1 type II toxin-antitoxin system RelE/ParE family toxin [Pseudomonas amygdali pv. morsprunorum]
MLPVIWLDDAIADLTAIITFIAGENPGAARRLKVRLENAPLSLSEHPYLYPVGLISGTREIVAHPNYVIVYRVTERRIEIVNVLHARQQYP